MNIIQTKFVYTMVEGVKLEDALMSLVEEAENWGYHHQHILEAKEKNYIFMPEIMEICNWDKEKAVEYLLNQ